MNSSPLVLCLTNTVASNFTANVLLAIGAKPAMMSDPGEAAELAAMSSAVLINVGTVDASQADAMRATIAVCNERHIPWVLDPVAAHLLTYRQQLVNEFLALKPAILRGNHAEITHFLGSVPQSTAVLSTGEIDRIYADGQVEELTGGVEMLTRVTATGCAQGAICAAFLGWGQTPPTACKSASKLMKAAGSLAFERAPTPGSFQIALLDALYTLNQ